MQCTQDYPEHVCEVLLTLERIEGEQPPLPARVDSGKLWRSGKRRSLLSCPLAGTLEDWDTAVQRTETRLARVKEQRAKVKGWGLFLFF